MTYSELADGGEDYRDLAKDLIIKHEGCRSKPYKDTVGVLTIGIGRNLDSVGLHPDEIQVMFENDLREAERTARKLVRNFDNLSDVRKAVILDISFNLGETRLSKFKNTLKAINEERWEDAAKGLENSLWYKQVGNRSKELVALFRGG